MTLIVISVQLGEGVGRRDRVWGCGGWGFGVCVGTLIVISAQLAEGVGRRNRVWGCGARAGIIEDPVSHLCSQDGVTPDSLNLPQ